MDPIHLRPSELEYELAIRNIIGLSNQRIKTSTIREYLRREAMGIETSPNDSGQVYASADELVECAKVSSSINAIIVQNEEPRSSLVHTEAEHRIIHLKGRLKRINAKTEEEHQRLQSLLKDCDGLVQLMVGDGRPSIENRISPNFPELKKKPDRNSFESVGAMQNNTDIRRENLPEFQPDDHWANAGIIPRLSQGRGRGHSSASSAAADGARRTIL